jgi:catechol 2,3-dioxygenase-like lactoylglutathione lyase family enzyme
MLPFVADCIQSDSADDSRPALRGLRGVDHFGITVPDMAEAEHFLVQILGAIPVYSLPGKDADDGWMAEHLGVHPRTAITEIRFYRLANGGNLEVFTYDAADGQAPPPRNSDVGGHHLALYVDDIDQAVDDLRSHGVDVMGEPVTSKDASLGQRWVYFRAPWGMQFELVSYPSGKAYEATSDVRLWHPVHDSL